ncbi:MAG: NAD(P)/FAD-dependent oxidoreductase, partial [Gammaproteobacteria bacterium]|nr:NAD(P)/FAD-dependent oxidoreductase [Gammaproteobacteria bacterium]
MSTEKVDCVVVGAGVIGLALARELARSGREVIVVEREAAFGSGISSRNSEVVHAGLYYETGSLKAQLSVRGRQLLYDYCDAHHVATRKCGKLVVATDKTQLGTLDRIAAQAVQNGVKDCSIISGQQAMQLEPELYCEAALLSPSTGVVDSHGLMLSLLGEAEEAGAMIAYQSPVGKLVTGSPGLGVCLEDEDTPLVYADLVINAAGFGAIPLLSRSQFNLACPTQVPAKGNYFKLDGSPPVQRLIYPVPEEGGLGVHITLDLAGRARFGPDVE